MSERLSENELSVIRHLIIVAGCATPDDNCLLIFDDTTVSLAKGFIEVAKQLEFRLTAIKTPVGNMHGAEPSIETHIAMGKHSLIFALTKYSLAHTKARLESACQGARFLSLPMYDRAMLSDPCLMIDYRKQRRVVEDITNAFSKGNSLHITTAAGTDIFLDINGRSGNCCPGYVNAPSELGSPPDIESNISPQEDMSRGVVIIDGSVTCPEIGLLTAPIQLDIENGRIVNITSDNHYYVSFLEQLLGPKSSKRRVLAECGVGLNPLARLTGNMLTDEGAYGCLHFGFGSNSTVGGENTVDFHLDFVFKDATLVVDNNMIISKGNVLL